SAVLGEINATPESIKAARMSPPILFKYLPFISKHLLAMRHLLDASEHQEVVSIRMPLQACSPAITLLKTCSFMETFGAELWGHSKRMKSVPPRGSGWVSIAFNRFFSRL